MIKRILKISIEKELFGGKALIIMGARQTGKTTLLNEIFANREKVIWFNADEPDVVALFENPNSVRLKSIFGDNRIVVIDEAQRIENVGLKFKLITDTLQDIQLVATGSSSFDLSNKINEPLTGRKWEHKLFPVSTQEMINHHGLLDEMRKLPDRLIYGFYPEVLTSPGKERKVLKEITDSYLYKDLLKLDGINKSDKLIKLLQALAYQVGSEVSYNELGSIINLDNETVEKYITILEKAYVIFRLGVFSRNLRSELKRTRKVYFYDNGIRNAIIANFALPELRQDIGALWENFIISERMKYLHYNEVWSNCYFWRTQDQQEIDFIEERDGVLHAAEFKWNAKKIPRLSKTFTNAYPNHTFRVITPENYESFVSNVGYDQ
ncbi:MAG: ATP-binding protein [Bacteroidales bacterium]|nr:ATP-binding protein [Bacteroidales bacterium]